MNRVVLCGIAAMLVVAALMLSGCGDNRFSSPEERKHAAQMVIDSAEKVCIDHVEYLSFPNSYGRTYSGHFRVDGSLYSC